MAQGQINWKSSGSATKSYIVNPALERGLAYQFRNRSALGRLSKPIMERMISDNGRMRSQDLAATAVIQRKEIKTGDEARFTLIQNIKGAATHGDAPVRTGDYLAYLHKNIKINQIHTPAIPMMEEMSRMRVAEVLSGEENEVRRQLEMWLAEEYTYDGYSAMFNGASKGLLTIPENEGGLNLDLGRGAGKGLSIEHILIAGKTGTQVGELSYAATSSSAALTAYEVAINTALIAADAQLAGAADDAARQTLYGFHRGIIADLRDWVVTAKIAETEVAGNGKWFVACDPSLLKTLTRQGGELFEAWKYSRERAESNPVFGYDYIELDDFVFFKDPYLKQFRPVVGAGGAEITWGNSGYADMRERAVPTSNWAPMLILGNQAMMEATSGTVSLTSYEGKHGQGCEIAGHIKQSFMRTQWQPKDGRTTPFLNQSSALVLAYAPTSTFTNF